MNELTINERMHSDQINEIAKALSNLQGDLGTVNKNAKGYNYKYATLDECMTVLKPLLKKNNLCIVQPLKVDQASGNIYVETMLVHQSGQYFKSICRLEVSERDVKMSAMQKMGSAITYARRYALGGITGLTTEEDTDDQPQRTNDKPILINPNKPMKIENKKAGCVVIWEYILNKVGGNEEEAKVLVESLRKDFDFKKEDYNQERIQFFKKEIDQRTM